MEVSSSADGEYAAAMAGNLTDSRNKICQDIFVEAFSPTFAVTARYIKFYIDSYHGSIGGGLQYLGIRGYKIDVEGRSEQSEQDGNAVKDLQRN